MYSDKELRELQIKREEHGFTVSREAALKKDEKARKKLRPSMLENISMDELVAPIAASIEAQIPKSPYRGTKADNVSYARSNIRKANPYALGVSALRALWSLTTGSRTVTGFTTILGKHFALCLDIAEAVEVNGEVAWSVNKAVKHKIATAEWDDRIRAYHGSILLNALLECGLVSFSTKKSHKVISGKFTAPQKVVAMTDKAQEIVQRLYASEDLCGMFRPVRSPMVCPPNKWGRRSKGPYMTTNINSHLGLIKRSATVKGQAPSSVTSFDAPVVRTVNSLQEVPLRINKDALALRRFVWDNSINMGDNIPQRVPLPVPDVPDWALERGHLAEKDAFWKDYSRRKRINKAVPSNVSQWEIQTETAAELDTLGIPFYLPHNLDYRGRVYPISVFSHHSTGSVNALFEFANGMPLGQDGLFWLKVHVANSGDFNKVSKESFQARADWCDENRALIEEMADDWQNSRMWAEADAPFAFFVGAMDLVRAWRSPDPSAYVSHVPVALDGSNSGVQHYSGVMRAEEGVYVGLVPSDKPNDLYNVVAKEVWRVITENNDLRGVSREELLASETSLSSQCRELDTEILKFKESGDKELAKAAKASKEELTQQRQGISRALWELEGVTRSTVKRPVMTYGYSSNAAGFAEQIRADYMEPLALRVMRGELPEHPFGCSTSIASYFLGKEIFSATKSTLPRVTEAMNWLKKVALILGKNGLQVTFTTPSGFQVRLIKTEKELVRIALNLLGISSTNSRYLMPMLVDKKDKPIDVAGMQSSISPNVIHACDGSHLSLTVNRMADQGFSDMLCIHDSFASHAGCAGVLLNTLRTTFTEQYADWCPLEEIYASAVQRLPKGTEVPQPPAKGSLDLNKVLQSDYLFS